MPFPLAHPAAVLPFRRYCPRLLSFPALIVGSLSPDFGYFFSPFHLGDFAHRLVGIVGFGLPTGVLILWLVSRIGPRIGRALPNPLRRVCAPLWQRPFGPPLAVVCSVLIGASTHVLWDSCTHQEGWLSEHLPILQSRIVQVGHHRPRLCHWLWYGSTFAGVAWLGMAYQDRREVANSSLTPASRRVRLANSILVGGLALPIAVAHHLIHSPAGKFLVAALSGLLVVAFALWVERGRERRGLEHRA
jgi:hypothetical protein